MLVVWNTMRVRRQSSLRLVRAGWAGLGLLGAVVSSHAYMGPVAVPDLTRESEVIVVAEVTEVSGPEHQRVATAEVLDIWKGRPGRIVRFLASPSWNCDTSDAEAGEHVVLFLQRRDESDLYAIAWSGRGRVRVHETGAEKRVHSMDVIWPEHADPSAGNASLNGVPLNQFKSRIVELGKAKE